MSAYWSIVSHAPGDSELVLVDGPPYDPWVLVGKDFPPPQWSHDFSGARGTRGRRPSPGELDNRQANFTFLGTGTDKDDMAALMSQLSAAVDRCRRYGGVITFREHDQSYRQHYEVLVGAISLAEWGTNESELRDGFRPAISATVEPYIYGDEMDFLDDFTEDLISTQYEADAGALTNVLPADGLLASAASPTTENRLIVTGPGYQMGDHQCRVKLQPGATITSLKGGVVIKRIDAANYLEVYLDDNGTNSRLRIDKVVEGARTNLASENLSARMSAGYGQWTVQGRIEGNVVFAECYLPTNSYLFTWPAADNDLDYTLTGDEADTFGIGARGLGGITFTPQDSAAALSDLRVEPFTYLSHDRSTILCDGEIPGDAPAICDVAVTYPSGGNAQAFGMIAWSERPDSFSYVGNWGFEASTARWSVAAVSGVTGAATSVTRVTTDRRYGIACGSVVCPATANTGASYRIDRRFRRGVSYTASVWVKSAAATTNARLRLGISGDIASETASALSSTWTKRTVTWTPTADSYIAYLAFEITAATATTMLLDGAMVYEGAEEPALPAKTYAGMPAWGYIDGLDTYSGNGTRVSNANADGGYYNQLDSSVSTGGATNNGAAYALRPELLPSDDYALAETEVEVWARLLLSSAFDGGVTATLRVSSGGYSHEWGTSGASLVMPNATNAFRLCRLGTITLRRAEIRATTNIQIGLTIASGTNAQPIGIDGIWLVNPNARASTPTGIEDDSSYPNFWASSTRHVFSDLSGAVEDELNYVSAETMGQAPIEFPTGPFEMIVLGANRIPDAPDVSSTADTPTIARVHLRVRPRWHFLRDA